MKVASDTDDLCVLVIHIQIIFVTKYRRPLFTKAVRDNARIIFASVCANFGAELGVMARASLSAG